MSCTSSPSYKCHPFIVTTPVILRPVGWQLAIACCTMPAASVTDDVNFIQLSHRLPVTRHIWQTYEQCYVSFIDHIYGLVQERHNSSVLAMELRLSCTNPLIFVGPLIWEVWRGCNKKQIRSWWRHQINHFLRHLPSMRRIHRSPVNSPHKGQWRRALLFSLICSRINGWVNNGEAGDLRRHRTHYDVTLMVPGCGAWGVVAVVV